MHRRPYLLAASTLAALMAVSAPARAGVNRPRSAAAPAAASKIGELSRAELSAKLATMQTPKLQRLFDQPEGEEIAEMPASGTHNGFELVYRGIEATAFDDADNVDEVAVWIAVVRPTAAGYVKSVHKIGTPIALSQANPGSVTGAATLFDGDRTPALVVGAVIEDDDGSAAAWIAELDVMLDQAIAAATLLREPDDDPVAVLHGTIELARLMLGADPARPDLAIRPLRSSDWDLMWDLSPTIHGGAAPGAFRPTPAATKGAAAGPSKADKPRFVYKLSLPAKVGTGRYNLRLDVPAAPGRKPRRIVRVHLDELRVTTPSAEVGGGTEFFVRVCISQGGVAGMNHSMPATSCFDEKVSPPFGPSSWKAQTIFRRVRQGKTYVSVYAYWKRTSGSAYKFLDLDQGELGFAKFETNVVDGPVGLQYTVVGDGDGGGLYNFTCYSCGFPSGAADGSLALRIRH